LVIASRSVIAHDLISLAWLIVHWRQAPWLNRQALTDPNSNRFVTNVANRVVCGILGGWKWSFSAESMKNSPLPNIWRDRTLRRACELMGGVPDIQLLPTQSDLSPQLLAELAAMVALPEATQAA
jgi:hypothetical protein